MQRPRHVLPLLLGVSALFGLTGEGPRPDARAAPAGPATTAGSVYKVPVDTSPVLGPHDALVTAVIFGGLECRFSQALIQTLVTLQRAQPKDVRLVWKHFPLTMHARSVPAAEAAVEAHRANRFWPFLERLRTARLGLDDASLERAGVAAGVGAGRITAALGARTHRAAVLADQQLGSRLRVMATPSLFVNGLLIPGGALPAATLKVHLARAQREAMARLRGPGVTRKNLYDRIIAAGLQPGPVASPAPLPRLAVLLPGVFGRRSSPATTSPTPPSARVVRLTNAPSHGPEDAMVTAILFANFRCGNVNDVWTAYQEAAREQPGSYRLYFVHHGLGPNDPLAWQAGQAALAAHAAGKFWELAEVLFQNRYQLAPDKLAEYVAEVGLDSKTYAAAMKGGAYRPVLQRESEESRRFLAGSQACPTFWVNGQIHSGYLSTYRVKAALVQAAREVQGLRVQPLP